MALPVRALKIANDTRGPFVVVRIKQSILGGRTVALPLTELNGERLFRLLGRHGVPLVSVEARSEMAATLQKQICRLVRAAKAVQLADCGVQYIETPLT